MELQGERLELFNEIINLDTESIEKVKKYIKRIASNRYKISRTTQVDDIDIITDEEIENAMRPLSYEEKIESLRLSEAILFIIHRKRCEKLLLHGETFNY